jgi:hypothetical protein
LRLGVRIVFEAVDDAENAIFDQRHLEVDEQAQSLVGQPEIGQKLLFVDWREEFDGLHFHNHFLLDDQVGAEAGVDADFLVDHRDRLLPSCSETSTIQLVRQDCIVNRFQQARSECGVNAEGRVHDFLGDGVLSHGGPSQFRANPPTTAKLLRSAGARSFVHA